MHVIFDRQKLHSTVKNLLAFENQVKKKINNQESGFDAVLIVSLNKNLSIFHSIPHILISSIQLNCTLQCIFIAL